MKAFAVLLAFCLICASLPCLAQDRPPAPVVDIADTVPTLPAPPPPPKRPVKRSCQPGLNCGSASCPNRASSVPVSCSPGGCTNGSCGQRHSPRRGYFFRWRR